MKTIDKIQKVAFAGRIISRIFHIAFTVGAILCVVGMITLAVIPNGIKVGGVEIHALIEASSTVNIGSCYIYSMIGLVFCLAEAALAKLAESYFIHELAAGTPFTFDGAAEMKQLGIYVIGVSFTAILISSIIYAVMSRFFTNVADLHFTDFSSIGIGVMFIIMSILCKHAAEINEANAKEAGLNV